MVSSEQAGTPAKAGESSQTCSSVQMRAAVRRIVRKRAASCDIVPKRTKRCEIVRDRTGSYGIVRDRPGRSVRNLLPGLLLSISIIPRAISRLRQRGDPRYGICDIRCTIGDMRYDRVIRHSTDYWSRFAGTDYCLLLEVFSFQLSVFSFCFPATDSRLPATSRPRASPLPSLPGYVFCARRRHRWDDVQSGKPRPRRV